MFPSDTKILVVDDTDTMREMLTGLLRELGYANLFQAKNGSEAFDLVSRENNINLILSDWHMPEMDGLELLKLLRTVEIRVPFVLITTERETQNVVTALKAGANNYIVKPVSKQVLADKLAAVWAKCNPAG